MTHATIETTTILTSDTSQIREEVYTDHLKAVTVRTKKNIRSSDHELLADYVNCLDVIRDGSTKELELIIKRYKDGEVRITKVWTVTKQ